MGTNRILEMILQWNIVRRRGKGKPKELWIDGVKRSKTSKNLTKIDAEGREL